ncbi:hypothetical protein BDA96_10G160900 [Sorghum bicolor]|uniref:Uncharacterized protein n=2 Tax=Sorghum bicolor TaxID=4558 RepID=A0A921Q4A9_SORBI|nr:hypothetical protein BDA96_10G160900 [Sorghum bicolor]OQU76305.1 hypothetical protein SORBI_3010G128601 [Sorghum bicolor]
MHVQDIAAIAAARSMQVPPESLFLVSKGQVLDESHCALLPTLFLKALLEHPLRPSRSSQRSASLLCYA